MYYENYDGAFFALSCLRGALMEFDREKEEKPEEKIIRRFNEIMFYVEEFYARRNRASECRKQTA